MTGPRASSSMLWLRPAVLADDDTAAPAVPYRIDSESAGISDIPAASPTLSGSLQAFPRHLKTDSEAPSLPPTIGFVDGTDHLTASQESVPLIV